MNSALPVLFALIGISLLATAVIVCLPPLFLKQQVPRSRESLVTLMFFLFIGAGYILVQVSLIQKFVLFLGHPTYALTVVIFSMLLSSGMGSFFSSRLVQQQVSRLTLVLLLIAAAVSALSLLVTPIADNGVTLPFPCEGTDYCSADCSCWFHHGNAISNRSQPAQERHAVGRAVGVGSERGC